MRLYELTNQFLQVQQLAENGELTPETISDTLEAISAEIDEKARAVVIVIKQLEAQSQAFDDEIARMAKLKKQCDSQALNLQEYLRDSMIQTGKDKLNLGLFSVTLRKASQKLNVLDESKIPGKYFETIPESKKLISSSLLADLKVGAVDGAELIDGKRGLLIK